LTPYEESYTFYSNKNGKVFVPRKNFDSSDIFMIKYKKERYFEG